MLGHTVKDRITGFEGVVTGRVEYLTGCNQCLVQPRVDEKGAHRDSLWIDEQRVVVNEFNAPIVLDNGATPGADKPAPRR